MGRKPKNKNIVEEIELEEGDVPGEVVSRKTFLRDSLIEHLEETYPELERKFSMINVCENHHTRGSFRSFMNGDFKAEDKKIFREILQDLKVEGVLIHVGGQWWARLK